jgi:hypothetical protein
MMMKTKVQRAVQCVIIGRPRGDRRHAVLLQNEFLLSPDRVSTGTTWRSTAALSISCTFSGA